MLSTSARRSLARPAMLPSSALRALHTSAIRRATGDAKERPTTNTESTETSKSGGDGSAAHSAEAFSADQTRPEEQRASAEQHNQSRKNPLDASPANTDLGGPRDPQEGGPDGSKAETGQGQNTRARTSGGGSAPKSGGG